MLAIRDTRQGCNPSLSAFLISKIWLTRLKVLVKPIKVRVTAVFLFSRHLQAVKEDGTTECSKGRFDVAKLLKVEQGIYKVFADKTVYKLEKCKSYLKGSGLCCYGNGEGPMKFFSLGCKHLGSERQVTLEALRRTRCII